MLHQTHISGDITGLLYLVTNGTMMLVARAEGDGGTLQTIAMVLGILGSIVVVIDHVMKIVWKVKKSREERATKKDEAAK